MYAAYKLFWAHKYYSYYKEICENFIIPLYTLIFLVECNCMSEESMKVVQDNGHYYLTEEGLYLMMFGGSRAPSLLPRYATDYVIHKEVIRRLYIDGVGNFLFEQKKTVYSVVPFFVGSYKFSKVKKKVEFMKELEYFHFGEIIYHRNDAEKKEDEYCAAVRVHFEYADFWDKDEEIFQSAQNMTALRRIFKQKINNVGGKGKDADKL